MKKLIVIPLLFLLIFLFFSKETEETRRFNGAKRSIHECGIEPYLREIFSHDLGYTLFGEKPISFTSCYRLKFHPKVQRRLFEFLKTTFHDSPRFILKIFDHPYCPHNIILIHKDALHRTICKEPILYAFVKEYYGDENRFFSDLQDPNKDIFTSFFYDPFLLGIALGYGKGNSEFFIRRCSLRNSFEKFSIENSFSFFLHPTPFSFHDTYAAHIHTLLIRRYPCLNVERDLGTPEFQSPEEEWKWIEENRVPIIYVLPPVLFQMPVFIACRGSETEEITKRFATTMTKLTRLFEKRQFKNVLVDEAQKSSENDSLGKQRSVDPGLQR